MKNIIPCRFYKDFSAPLTMHNKAFSKLEKRFSHFKKNECKNDSSPTILNQFFRIWSHSKEETKLYNRIKAFLEFQFRDWNIEFQSVKKKSEKFFFSIFQIPRHQKQNSKNAYIKMSKKHFSIDWRNFQLDILKIVGLESFGAEPTFFAVKFFFLFFWKLWLDESLIFFKLG